MRERWACFETSSWLNSGDIWGNGRIDFPILQRITGDENRPETCHTSQLIYHIRSLSTVGAWKCYRNGGTGNHFLTENADFHLPALLMFIALERGLMLHMSTIYPKHPAWVISKRRLAAKDCLMIKRIINMFTLRWPDTTHNSLIYDWISLMQYL